MKFNKWTLCLAAVGVVSLASAAKADENQNFVQTALSGTTISGYVDTSLEWTISPGVKNSSLNSAAGFIPFRGNTKQNGFNLNVVELNLQKPLDESQWAAGYKVSLLYGPDAVGWNTSANVAAGSDFSVKNAYVELRTPLGNGIDWKVGTFDTIIGYEVFESGSNPNFTRSWGYAIEPTEHTGILASYQINDEVSVSLGVANTLISGINARNISQVFANYWCKTWMGSVALTAPKDWGWVAGSTMYAGIVYGFNGSAVGLDNQVNYYAGLTMNTPVTALTTGFSFDYVSYRDANESHALAIDLYGTFKATEKLSLSGRAEYAESDYGAFGTLGNAGNSTGGDYALTGTVQYDLWENVISRLEFRWDYADAFTGAGIPTGAGASGQERQKNAVSLYANLIYKF